MVEETPQDGKVLLDGCRGSVVFFDVGGDMEWLNIG
jgi:hypothetical protein